jgi:hypothetical protein
MSFKQTYSDVYICNLALSRLKQEPINSINPPGPNGKAAREMARWYEPTVARLLETHHWGLAAKRTTLTATTNDRDGDGWLYAWQKPTDMAFPVRFAGLGSTSALNYYRGLGGIIAMLSGEAIFLVAGDRIYTKHTGDEIDYTSFDITEAAFTATFVDILVKQLAANTAFAITGNKKLADDMNSEAINAINFAITQNLNAGQPRYGDQLISETDRARGAGFGQHSWDWNYGVYPA